MNIFDIIGPVMVGPSSSHTAGAVRIGLMARKLLGEGTPKSAQIVLYGSFAATGQGHGTDRAIVAGLLGMKQDDERITGSYDWAKKADMEFALTHSKLSAEHPNTARLHIVGKSGRELSMTAASLGGGRIMVTEMNGLRIQYTGDLPTLIVQNEDRPGHVGDVTGTLARAGVNIATMHVYRDHPGGDAVMIIETDKNVPQEVVKALTLPEGIERVTFIEGEQNG